MKTYNNTPATESTNARNSFAIYRDILRLTDDGESLPAPFPREWLHVTPSGRYVWQSDRRKADAIGCNDSCRIIDNLNAHGNFYRFNYGKFLNK